MGAKCPYFYKLREQGLVKQAKAWLKDNPPPKRWSGSAWRWAFENMPEVS